MSTSEVEAQYESKAPNSKLGKASMTDCRVSCTLDLATALRAGFSIESPHFCGRMPIASILSLCFGTEPPTATTAITHQLECPVVILEIW
jgi:hypothetical protein